MMHDSDSEDFTNEEKGGKVHQIKDCSSQNALHAGLSKKNEKSHTQKTSMPVTGFQKKKNDLELRIVTIKEEEYAYRVTGIITQVSPARRDAQKVLGASAEGMSAIMTIGHCKLNNDERVVKKQKGDNGKTAWKPRIIDIETNDNLNVGLIGTVIRIDFDKDKFKEFAWKEIDGLSKDEFWTSKLIGWTVVIAAFDCVAYQKKDPNTRIPIPDSPINHSSKAGREFSFRFDDDPFFTQLVQGNVYNSMQAFAAPLCIVDPKPLDDASISRIKGYQTQMRSVLSSMATELKSAQLHKMQPNRMEVQQKLEVMAESLIVEPPADLSDFSKDIFAPFAPLYKGDDTRQVVTLVNTPRAGTNDSFLTKLVTDNMVGMLSDPTYKSTLPPITVVTEAKQVECDQQTGVVQIGWRMYIYDLKNLQNVAASSKYSHEYMLSDSFTSYLPTKYDDVHNTDAEHGIHCVTKMDSVDLSNSFGNPEEAILNKMRKNLPYMPFCCTILARPCVDGMCSSYVGDLYIPFLQMLNSPLYAIQLSKEFIKRTLMEDNGKIKLTIESDGDGTQPLNQHNEEKKIGPKTRYDGFKGNLFQPLKSGVQMTFPALQTKVDELYGKQYGRENTFSFAIVLFKEYDRTPFINASSQTDKDKAFEALLDSYGTTTKKLLEDAEAGMWVYTN